MGARTLSRRDFFRNPGATAPDPVPRPPWITDDSLARCTSCGDCVAACPENILTADEAGRPVVDFSSTGCTFCGDCAGACDADVFGDPAAPGWDAMIAVDGKCLLAKGISCQLCTDFCDHDALGFDVMARRPVGALVVTADNCTACGMCIGACPVGAISIQPRQPEVAA